MDRRSAIRIYLRFAGQPGAGKNACLATLNAMNTGKRIISFSLWGGDPKYTVGAIRNADLARDIYPGWICRFYCGRSVPADVLSQLRSRENVEVVRMDEAGNWKGCFWRFAPASEPDVEVMVSRDTDSRLSLREKAAVTEWLGSGNGFHIMRDHPCHGGGNQKGVILGGMWGARRGTVPKMKTMMDRFRKTNCWQSDQWFLNTHVYPLIRADCIVHDEFFERRPFPVKRIGTEFVGQVFDSSGRPHQGYARVLERCIASPDPKVPKVSIIASVNRGSPCIEGFLENIIRQTVFSSCEVILVDCHLPDQEADGVQRCLEGYPNIVCRRLDHNPGLFAAWNHAIRMSTGEYIAGVNITDRLFPEHIEVHARHLREFDEAALVYSDRCSRDFSNGLDGIIRARNVVQPHQRSFPGRNVVYGAPGGCPVWRRSLHDMCGWFDESFRSAGDLDMWMRAAGKGLIFCKIPGVYCMSPVGLSGDPRYGKEHRVEARRVFRTHWRSCMSFRLVLGMLIRNGGPAVRKLAAWAGKASLEG